MRVADSKITLLKSSKLFLLMCLILLGEVSLATEWQTVLNCNNEAAIVQIDRNERRSFQMVIKDPNIIVYFNGRGAFRNPGNNFGNGREFIVGGYLQNGIFSAADFRGGSGLYNYGDSFQIERDYKGLKIILQNISSWTACDGDTSPSTGMCNGTVRRGVNIYEYANWYFDQCN